MEDSTATKARIVGRYALYDAIASGGMATVHYGRLMGPVGFSRTVAIKRLHAQFARDPEFVSMFLDEARLAARIRHPNVVPTLDVVATDGELFLVMEYVSGESLARLIRTAATKGSVIPPRIVVAIMCGVLRGLHAAHEATNERGEPLGIVHRDVSPQNVLVSVDGQARVLDFGVAKAAGRLQTTRDGKLKGKLAYMSPEQLRGKPIDRRTDIFAAATVLWETLTGRRLFRGDNEGAIVTKILEGNFERPSDVVSAEEADEATRALIRSVDDITLKGLATHVDDRWESGRAMAIALERAIPPAGTSEVSEWVEHFANDVIATRARQVADIESNSAVGPVSLRAINETARAASDAETSVARGAVAEAPNDERTITDGSRPAPASLSTISVASQANHPALSPARGRRAGLLVGGGVAVAVVVAGLGVALRKGSPDGGTAASLAAPVPPASVAAAGVASVLPVVAAAPSTATAPPPELEAGRTAAATASVARPAAPPSTSHASHPARPTMAAASPPPAPPAPAAHGGGAPSCNPPFTYDGQGLKHFKPECL